MNTDIALITYTNSVMEDIWPIYFGELENNLNKCIKSFVFSDVLINIDENKNTKCILYENSSPYYQQYVSGLDSVSENYIIYAQEDFFLYGKVDHEKIIKLKNILENSSYDYIRLIRAGYETPLNQSEYENLYKVDMNSSDAFSMQATIWKKSSLIKLYKDCKSIKWLESEDWNESSKNTNIKGLFYYNEEKKVGKFHYESSIYPYTCTGVNKGKWNINEYKDFLYDMFQKYNIDPDNRGMRLDYNKWTK
jgi:hypothetical protein